MENVVYSHHTWNYLPSAERILSVLAGSALIYYGVKSRNTLLALPGSLIALRGVSGYCPFYDIMGKEQIRRHNVNIQTTFVINKSVDVVYKFWRNLENLPLFMEHLESVKQTGLITSHWTAKIPGGIGTVSWNAVIVNDKENEVIGWSSFEDSTVDNAGKIEFKQLGPYTTELHVVISYRAPMGKIGEDIARIFVPTLKKTIKKDIERFAEYIENGFAINSRTDFRNELI
ncbi:MAG TPA: YgaP-like transmembrane domain [Flavobacterium sp.]|jgi:uncharacterized membrane protein